MLEGKNWRPDAVIRLFAGVFVCMYAGSLLASLVLGRPKAGAEPNRYVLAVAGAFSLSCLGSALYLLGRPWRHARLGRQLAVTVGCFYAGVFGGLWTQSLAGPPGPSVWQLVMASAGFQGAALLLVWRFVAEHDLRFDEAFGFTRGWGFAVVIGLIAALLFLPVGWGLQQISGFIMTNIPLFGVEPHEQQAVQTFRTAGNIMDRAVLGAVTILIAPPAEELLFRGVLYTWIKNLGFPRVALWGTSLLFAAVHLNLVTFIPLLVLALVLVWLYERTGNLLAPIAAHSLFNALNVALFYLTS